MLAQLPAIVETAKHEARRAIENAHPLPPGELINPTAADQPPTSNKIIHGDNLTVMAALLKHASLRNGIDLIYIDPPFDSNANYTAATGPDKRLRHAYSDTWENGTQSYLAMLTPRLYLMKELLSDTGSIYVHLDWHVGHYVKIILDEIFGRDRFRNDIIWHYENKLGTGWSAKTFDSRHDLIFLYSKQKTFTHTPIAEPVKHRKPQPVTQKIAGQRIWLKNPDGTLKYQLGASERPVGDVWTIPIINPAAAERQSYKTQKPEALLTRIITASSTPGQLVADFFGGSGTTAAVAERLGRRWITVDSGEPACTITRDRLTKLHAKPFIEIRASTGTPCGTSTTAPPGTAPRTDT